jgi:ferrochelatase
VLRGRNVPRERMVEVAKHYELFDGISPINSQNRKLIALGSELALTALSCQSTGAINWHPLITDT